MVVLYEYIVSGPVSSSLSQSSPQYTQRTTCTIVLKTNNNHATVHPVGSTLHDALKTSPHTHWRPAIYLINVKMTYNLRPRKPPRRDAFLSACYDTFPPEVLRRILLLRIAMPHRYPLRSRRRKNNLCTIANNNGIYPR